MIQNPYNSKIELKLLMATLFYVLHKKSCHLPQFFNQSNMVSAVTTAITTFPLTITLRTYTYSDIYIFIQISAKCMAEKSL